MDLSLAKLHRQNMLMCNEWFLSLVSSSKPTTNIHFSPSCGVPIYANKLEIPCNNCSKPLKLYLNPRIIGTLLDETGCIAPGKLLWSERAWKQLLGRTAKEVTEMTNEDIRWLEQRMMFMRMHLVFGWEESVGRLAVLGMRA